MVRLVTRPVHPFRAVVRVVETALHQQLTWVVLHLLERVVVALAGLRRQFPRTTRAQLAAHPGISQAAQLVRQAGHLTARQAVTA